jgi:hypothetical protein
MELFVSSQESLEMEIIIDGTVVEGLGAATKTVASQLPHLIKAYPELSVCRPGTVNLRIPQALLVETPDFSCGPFVYGDGSVETFHFLRVNIKTQAGNFWQRAWVYIPEKSPHRINPFHVELIGGQLEGVIRGARCELKIERQHVKSTIITI